MRTVERLLARSVIELRQVDPASPDAQRCLRAYVAELNRRAPERGFDPSTGATVDPHEVRPPNGRSFSPTFRARRSAAAPSSTNRTTCLTSSACGSRNQREVWGSVAGSSSISGASAVSTHQTKHTRNQQTCCPRGQFRSNGPRTASMLPRSTRNRSPTCGSPSRCSNGAARSTREVPHADLPLREDAHRAHVASTATPRPGSGPEMHSTSAVTDAETVVHSPFCRPARAPNPVRTGVVGALQSSNGRAVPSTAGSGSLHQLGLPDRAGRAPGPAPAGSARTGRAVTRGSVASALRTGQFS